MLELLFIGAGPHSLATLTRLVEPNPDPGVDAPQRHVNAKSKVLSYWQWQRTCPEYRAALTAWLQDHVAVVDPSGDWMARWHQQFAALGISHLRSTTAVHPDPLDSYALATYASATNRTAELMPLEHIDKSRDFAGPFAVPGSRLFADFCRDLVRRYCLEGVVQQDKVVDLLPVHTPAPAHSSPDNPASGSPGQCVDHWRVTLASGRVLTAKRVVMAIGSTNMQRLPEVFQGLQAVPVLTPSCPAPSSCSSGSSFRAAGECAEEPQGWVQGSQQVVQAVGEADRQAAGDSSKAASSNATSECCSGCCDGACSDSSGWSSQSAASAAAAAAPTPPPAASGPEPTAASGAYPKLSVHTAPAAAGQVAAPDAHAAGSECSSSTVSSPRSGCASLCSWVDLAAPDDTPFARQQFSKPAPLVIDPADLPAGECALQRSSSLQGSTAASAPACEAVGAADSGPVEAAVGAAASSAEAGEAVPLGPCNWVSACSSPTSGCDSLCSWLGCEHTAAAAVAAAAAAAAQTQLGAQPAELCSPAAAAAAAEEGGDGPQLYSSSSSSSSLSSTGCNSSSANSACWHETAAASAPMEDAAAEAAGAAVAGSAVDSCTAASQCSSSSSSSSAPAGPAGSTYPWGRLMHAWQLVEALQAGSTSSTGRTAEGAPSDGSHQGAAAAAISSSGALVTAAGKGKRGQRLGRGKSQPLTGRSSKAAAVSAAASSAALLQQQGLLLPGETVMIVGGGLTTAHLASLAAAAAAAGTSSTPSSSRHSRRSRATSTQSSSSSTRDANSEGSGSSSSCGAGQAPVSLLLRGGLRVKQFDVDIEWMGRNRGSTLQFGFRQIQGFTDRLALMKRVLQGGSVNPEAAAVLGELRRSGLLEVHENSEVLDATWDWEQGRWEVWLQDGSLMHADRLWLATGSALSAQAEPLLASVLQQLPIPLVAGLPTVQPTLEWSAGSSLYVLGAYAALQLGPGALNLAGAKTGSVVMAQQLKGALPELPGVVVSGAAGLGGGSGSRQRGRTDRGKQWREG